MRTRSLATQMKRFFGVVGVWAYGLLLAIVVGFGTVMSSGCGEEISDSEEFAEVEIAEVDATEDVASMEYEDVTIEVVDVANLSDEELEAMEHGSYGAERIEEKAPPSGKTRYYSTGYFSDPGYICGGDWPADTVLTFSLNPSQCPDSTRLRIYATNYGSLCAIPGYLDARVYSDGHVEACAGFWSIQSCLASASLMKSTTYLWYE